MSFDKYIEGTLPDEERKHTDTVVEFIEVYNKWANDCHNAVVADRSKLAELTRDKSEARQVLQNIYDKYCTPKNRQYHRTHKGYFFYGGTYKSSNSIQSYIDITKNKVEIQTTKIKNIATAKKYTVVKQGQIWKIDTVEYLGGSNKWIFDIL